MRLLARGCGEAAVVCAAVCVAVRGGAAMSVYFEELDFRPTPMGVLSLRRRRHLASGLDIYEIKLGDEFLMSSAVHGRRDRARADRIGGARAKRSRCRRWRPRARLYRARPCSKTRRCESLIVVDALAEVIEWHEQGLLPLGKQLTGDPRCRLVNGDFFAMSHSADGFDSRCARPPLRCGAGGYRSLAAKPAASAPRRAVRAGGT